MYEWIPIVAILGSFIVTIVIVVVISNANRRRAELRADVQSKLIDKFGSAPELVAFLESPSGQQFVDRVQGAPAVATRERVVSGFRKAIILGTLGLAFLVIWQIDDNDGFVYPGFILVALGIGQVAGAYLSLRLSNHLGLDPYGGSRRDTSSSTL
jgi:hypothetical protein